MKPFPMIKIEFNGHRPTHKIRLKGIADYKMKNPLATNQKLKNPVKQEK